MSSLPASIKMDRFKNNREKVETSFSPFQVNGLSVVIETRVLIGCVEA